MSDNNTTNAKETSKKMLPVSKAEEKDYVPHALQKIMAMGGEQFIAEHPELENEQVDLIRLMAKCGTGDLGSMVYTCSNCENVMVIGKACHNSQCSNCQGLESEIFTEENKGMLVEGVCFHIVTTVPDELIPIFKMNKRFCYDLILKCASQAILDLCKDEQWLGGKPGIIAVLQTFGSKMNFHPHVHLIVEAAALNEDKTEIIHTPSERFLKADGSYKRKFFIPEAVLYHMFRGKFLSALENAYKKGKLRVPQELLNPAEWRRFIDYLYEINWICYCKQTFDNNGDAIKYISRYVARTAIGNSRIKKLTDKEVTYSYKDYKDGGKVKLRTVTIQQFIGLYIQHVLPKGFKKIRYSGFLAANKRKESLDAFARIQGKRVYEPRFTRKTKTKEILSILGVFKDRICRRCGKDSLELAYEFNALGNEVRSYPHTLTKREKHQKALNSYLNADPKIQKRIREAIEMHRNGDRYQFTLSLFPEDNIDPEHRLWLIDWVKKFYGTEMLELSLSEIAV